MGSCISTLQNLYSPNRTVTALTAVISMLQLTKNPDNRESDNLIFVQKIHQNT